MNNDEQSQRLEIAQLHFEQFYENFYNIQLQLGKFKEGSELGMHALCDCLTMAWNIHIAFGIKEGNDYVNRLVVSRDKKTQGWMSDFIKMAIVAKDQFCPDDRFAIENASVCLKNNKPVIEIEFGKEEPLG